MTKWTVECSDTTKDRWDIWYQADGADEEHKVFVARFYSNTYPGGPKMLAKMIANLLERFEEAAVNILDAIFPLNDEEADQRHVADDWDV